MDLPQHAVGLLVGAIEMQHQHVENMIEDNAKLSESEETLVEKIDASSGAFTRMVEARQQSLSGIENEYGQYSTPCAGVGRTCRR